MSGSLRSDTTIPSSQPTDQKPLACDQSYVFVNNLGSIEPDRQKTRIIRSQSQLSRFRSSVDDYQTRRLQQRSEDVVKISGFLPSWQSRSAVLADGIPSQVNARTDPFGVSPFPGFNAADQLLLAYVDDQSPAIFFTKAEHRQEAMQQRPSIWLPLAVNDKAAYSSLMAYILLNPQTPAHLRNEEWARRFLAVALSLTRQRLLQQEADDATLFSISMLEFSAWMMQDRTARENHHHGFAALLAFRANLVIDQAGYAQTSLAALRPLPSDDLSAQCDCAGCWMYDQRLISRRLARHFGNLKMRREFSTLVEQDTLAGPLLLNHVPSFTNQPFIERPETQADFLFDACQSTQLLAARMAFNTSHFRGAKTQDGVDRTHLEVFRRAGWQDHLDSLWTAFPSILLIIALVNATATSERSCRADFMWLLYQSRLHVRFDTYDALTAYFVKSFHWPDVLRGLCATTWGDVGRLWRCAVDAGDDFIAFGSKAQREYEQWSGEGTAAVVEVWDRSDAMGNTGELTLVDAPGLEVQQTSWIK